MLNSCDLSLCTDLFQSAPGREAGRCDEYPPGAITYTGYNPRPAVRPGDAPLSQRVVLKAKRCKLARTCFRQQVRFAIRELQIDSNC
jgi:hypothetical protein